MSQHPSLYCQQAGNRILNTNQEYGACLKYLSDSGAKNLSDKLVDLKMHHTPKDKVASTEMDLTYGIGFAKGMEVAYKVTFGGDQESIGKQFYDHMSCDIVLFGGKQRGDNKL